ncbi:DUF3616 domain-containing protein [Bradyrhizobium sp. CCBAU 65884]|uniref:DUF3616 domain-containing protein n=1 Tax=Bradyrhizobium sp. CCBAU 65884 TaxID=722477 RepID=UPI003FA4130A
MRDKDGRLYAGFRGPVVKDRRAAMVSVEIDTLFGGSGTAHQLFQLPLDGRGVRDLTTHGELILILAGPARTAQGLMPSIPGTGGRKTSNRYPHYVFAPPETGSSAAFGKARLGAACPDLVRRRQGRCSNSSQCPSALMQHALRVHMRLLFLVAIALLVRVDPFCLGARRVTRWSPNRGASSGPNHLSIRALCRPTFCPMFKKVMCALGSIASWADDYRAEHEESRNWHFVNIPLTGHA